MQLHGWKDEYQFHEHARATDANFLANIDFNIPVATINNIRENIRGTKWRYHENETKSLFRLIAEKAGSFVIKFKAMELLDDPQRFGGKLVFDMRPCYWCEATFDNSNDLYGHMLDCSYRDIDWNEEKVREWCSEQQWQRSRKFEKDVARLEEKASYCEEMVKVTEDFLRSVHGNTKLDVQEKMNAVMSPVRTTLPSWRTWKSEGTEDIELETSLRFLRGGPEAWKLKSFDVQLSKEDMDRIDAALVRFLDEGEKSELVAQIQLPFSATVTRESLQTLRPNSWLNDEVINFFMSKHNLYVARHARLERLPAPVVRCANSFFFTKLNREGYSAVKMWSRAGRRTTHAWLESKYVFIPINIRNAHWMCSVVDVQSKVIYIIDSFNDEYHDVGDKLLEWICEDGEANEISVGRKSAWKIVHKVLPKQMMQKNGSDCGMFVLAFCRDLCMRMSISPGAEPPGIVFTSESVADKRRRAVHEILKMGIQGRIDTTRPHVACSPNEKTTLQQVVDVKSPLGKQFYRDGATEKLPRVRIKQGRMEKQMVVYQPFILVLMRPAQERLLWKYGDQRCIQMDSTFNITRSKFSTFTLIARHPDGFYMPRAFFITSDERQETIVYCLQVIRDKINKKYSGGTWCPSTFMVDCCWAETNAIEQVFPKARVLWCQFHVFQAFNRNITSKLAEKQGEKASIAISPKERGQIKKILWKLVKETFQDDDAWDRAYTSVLELCDHKQKEIDKQFGDAAWTTWRSFRNYLETQWGRHRKLWARHFRSGLTYGTQETTGSIESFHGRWKARLLADGKGDIRSRRMDWLIHHLQHEIIPRYCDKVCQAETSMAPARVRKAMFHVVDDAKTIDDLKHVEKETGDEGTRFSVSYRVNYSGEVHNVSGLETLEDCALDRDHTQVKCSCALGRNGQVCAPKMKAMLMENELWTFKALNIQCKPDVVERTEFDVDVPMIQDDVEAFQPTHRRSLGAAFDNVSVKSRCAQITADLTQVALDPELTLEPDEAAHIIDTLAKLQRYMHNLKTHREMSQSMSKNSKMDGDGVIGMSNLVAIPMRGAAGDTALSRKRGWHEKMIDEHKRKASKGEQISIRNYLL